MISNGKWILAVTVVSITAAAGLSSARATCAVQDEPVTPAHRAADGGMLLAGDAGAFASRDASRLLAGDAGAPLTGDSGVLMAGDAGAPALSGDGGR